MKSIDQNHGKPEGADFSRAAQGLFPLLGEGARVMACLLLFLLVVLPVFSSPHIAWLRRYNLKSPMRFDADPFFGTFNQSYVVLAMTLDNSGNIIIGSTSTSASGDLDYWILKHSQNGTQHWAVTYNSGPSANDQLRAMSLDSNGNVYVTGTSKTVKYSSGGLLQWASPYGGRGIAVDSNEFVYVAGFQTNDFATVKLAPQGTNIWLRTYDRIGKPDVAQTVAATPAGEVYVAGVVHWKCDPGGCYEHLCVMKYDALGNQLWVDDLPSGGAYVSFFEHQAEAKKILLTDGNDFYITGNLYGGGGCVFKTARIGIDGVIRWSTWIGSCPYGVRSMVLDSLGRIYLTGSLSSGSTDFYVTLALSTNGIARWEIDYGPEGGYHQANSIALDSASNVYVTGQSSSTYLNPSFDFLTIKYDNDGHELWQKRYNGPANGGDIGMAISVGTDNSIYVAGYSANTNGTTDIVLIKYAELQNIQVQTNGSVLLQFFGTPGHSYAIDASTNLSVWQTIATPVADASGIYRFTDTNALAYPHRFYRAPSP